MILKKRASRAQGNWLPDMDLNHDKQIQSLLCYRYTIGQTRAIKVNASRAESTANSIWEVTLRSKRPGFSGAIGRFSKCCSLKAALSWD